MKFNAVQASGQSEQSEVLRDIDTYIAVEHSEMLITLLSHNGLLKGLLQKIHVS